MITQEELKTLSQEEIDLYERLFKKPNPGKNTCCGVAWAINLQYFSNCQKCGKNLQEED